MAELLLAEPRRCRPRFRIRRQHRSRLEAFLEITGGDQGSGSWLVPGAPPKK
ncbi:hypothetical protein J5Y04_16070 [Kitasatospora sp. RG8]|uniref:hypothetical protein n=1 Tax=Kitasatospora sp. RG8 TaxID=2820815 RepID=UPI001ADED967|nr:hypothetical protein [Kitasatospora sp. RG8]MBP0451047.1 hypothetical protein [Kitasatospora sp. RG8]